MGAHATCMSWFGSPISSLAICGWRVRLIRLEVEHAIEEGTSFKRCPDALNTVFKGLSQNAAARLTSATINMADLRCCAKSALVLRHLRGSFRPCLACVLARGVEPNTCRWVRVPQYNSQSSTRVRRPARRLHQPLGAKYLESNPVRPHQDPDHILDCITWLDTAYEHQWYLRAVHAKIVCIYIPL